MDLASRESIEHLCKKYKFWPSRRSGQNFLINPQVLKQIIDAAEIAPEDMILEIGAGFGTLSAALAERAGRVVAVEMDKHLTKALRKLATTHEAMTIVQGDIFRIWGRVQKKFKEGKYKLVSNLPYNITSLVLRQFTEQSPSPERLVVMVQSEVAERVTARPGAMSLLAVAVQFYADAEIVTKVPKENFWPMPQVDSAVLRLSRVGLDQFGYRADLAPLESADFFRIVRIGFAGKRKQLHNNIAAGLRISNASARDLLRKSGVNPASRAQDLAIADWIKITNLYHKK